MKNKDSFYVLVWGKGGERYPSYAYAKKKQAKQELKALGFKKVTKNLYELRIMDSVTQCEIMPVLGFVE